MVVVTSIVQYMMLVEFSISLQSRKNIYMYCHIINFTLF